MLPEVRAADRMDVGLARRSVHVDAIRASVSRRRAPAPHCRRRSDRGPGTGTRRCSTQPAVPITVPRETTATPYLRLPFPAGVGAAASGSLMCLRFKAYPSNCCSSTLADFGTTRKIVLRSVGPDTQERPHSWTCGGGHLISVFSPCLRASVPRRPAAALVPSLTRTGTAPGSESCGDDCRA